MKLRNISKKEFNLINTKKRAIKESITFKICSFLFLNTHYIANITTFSMHYKYYPKDTSNIPATHIRDIITFAMKFFSLNTSTPATTPTIVFNLDTTVITIRDALGILYDKNSSKSPTNKVMATRYIQKLFISLFCIKNFFDLKQSNPKNTRENTNKKSENQNCT